MKHDLNELMRRWHEGGLTDEQLRDLTTQLSTAEGRKALRDDWFLEAALPEALRTSAVTRMAPPDSRAEVVARLFQLLVPRSLPLWSKCSLAALPFGLVAALVAIVLAAPPEGIVGQDPALIARFILESQLPPVSSHEP